MFQDAILPTFQNESYSIDESNYRKGLINTLISISAAISFGICTYYFRGERSGLEFFAGYLVEQSLSVDNLFVFVLLFDYFRVPIQYQDRVLRLGIIGALIMRGVMIVIGVAAIQKFKWIVLVFAAILLFSAIKLLLDSSKPNEGLEDNFILKISRIFWKATPEYDGENFFLKEKGEWLATPLFTCLICIELSDVIFAVDSIPAVLGVSDDPFIVYSSNLFAILGLRSLYTLVSKAVHDLPYLKPAVAFVLIFVSCKMILEYFHIKISIGISLLVVTLLLTGGLVLSVFGKWFKNGVNLLSGMKNERYNN